MTKRANPVRSMRRLIVEALVVVLLTSACGVFNVVSVIKEGQRVGIDPCSLIDKAEAERILGVPVTDPALVVLRVLGVDVLGCSFEKRDGPDVGEAIGLSTNAVTQKQLLDTDEIAPRRPVSIGKEASWWIPGKGPGRGYANGVHLNVLSEEGVRLNVSITDARREGEAILGDAESLAKSALERIKKKFPGKFEPPASTIDPANPCPLLSLEEAQEFVGKSEEGAKGIPTFEVFGGRFGGYRGCSYSGETSTSFRSFTLTLSKDQATIDEMKRIQGEGETIKGLGSYAYWIPQGLMKDSGQSSVSVLTINGYLLRVNFNTHDPLPAEQTKALVVQIAKKVLPRIK